MEYRLRRYDGEYRWVRETQVARFEPGLPEDGRDLVERRLLDQDRAEHRLLRLEAVGEIAGGGEDEGAARAPGGIVLGHEPAHLSSQARRSSPSIVGG